MPSDHVVNTQTIPLYRVPFLNQRDHKGSGTCTDFFEFFFALDPMTYFTDCPIARRTSTGMKPRFLPSRQRMLGPGLKVQPRSLNWHWTNLGFTTLLCSITTSSAGCFMPPWHLACVSSLFHCLMQKWVHYVWISCVSQKMCFCYKMQLAIRKD